MLLDSKIEEANACIEANSKQAVAISFIPLVSVPLVHGLCVKMITQLDKIFGISTDKRFGSEIFSDILAGIMMAPAMAIPILGAGVAHTYIKCIGDYYAKAVAAVLASATPEDLEDKNLIADRVKKELQDMHNQRRVRRLEA